MTLNELKSKGDLDPSVLSHRILIKRIDRPDEWSMDELARKALKLENQNKDLLKKFYYVSKELEESKRENETLKAIVMPIGQYYIDRSTQYPCRKELRLARDFYRKSQEGAQ
jgi:hypothetical protein